MSVRTKTAFAAIALVGAFGAMTVHSLAQHNDRQSLHEPNQHRPPLSQEDRAAFLDARLAAIHAGLRLTADQEKLWPPVEAAVREKAKVMAALLEKNRNAGRPQNPVEGLRRRGEIDATRGAADTKLADAAQPLWATLTEEQKHRLHMLMHGMMGKNQPDMRHAHEHGAPNRRD